MKRLGRTTRSSSKLGGDKMPPAIRFDLCSLPEEHQDFERAVKEYEKFAAAYPIEQHTRYKLIDIGALGGPVSTITEFEQWLSQ